jgi:hypothetical protein
MEIQIAKNVQHHNADKNVQRVCQKVKLIEMTFVVTPAGKMDNGNKVFIQEFIEILKLLKL